jgi:hypothetical protein
VGRARITAILRDAADTHDLRRLHRPGMPPDEYLFFGRKLISLGPILSSVRLCMQRAATNHGRRLFRSFRITRIPLKVFSVQIDAPKPLASCLIV